MTYLSGLPKGSLNWNQTRQEQALLTLTHLRNILSAPNQSCKDYFFQEDIAIITLSWHIYFRKEIWKQGRYLETFHNNLFITIHFRTDIWKQGRYLEPFHNNLLQEKYLKTKKETESIRITNYLHDIYLHGNKFRKCIKSIFLTQTKI